MRFILIAFILTHTILNATTTKKTTIKHKLNCNMTIKYKKRPKNVDNLTDFINEGIFYGRLRLNNFKFDNIDNDKDFFISGIGGSLVYKSAYLKNIGVTAGLYTSQNIGDKKQDLAADYRSAKDVLNRYDVATNNDFGITSLAQIYAEYRTSKQQLKIGRFPLETLLLKSNDTKMIPNTFEGIYYKNLSIPKTSLKTAFIQKQKLRDHTSFHHVLAYGDSTTDEYAKWTQNDDGAMHRGLTLSKLKAKNINDEIFLIETKNSTINNLTLKANYTTIPQLLSYFVFDGKYRVHFDDLMIIPAVHYMQQFDDGAGAIGGANLKNNTTAYNNKNSLKASLIASRIDIIKNAASLRLGYSKTADKGDFVTPWRAFPTAGYTRAMGQTNWYANTEAFMIRADYDFSKTSMLPGVRTMIRYAIQNFDDKKAGVQADNHVFEFNIVKHFKSIPNFRTKLRAAFVNGDKHTIAKNNSIKADPSYNELRLEFNYLF
jgi:hypothetical protein